jgi:hypothetical protein
VLVARPVLACVLTANPGRPQQDRAGRRRATPHRRRREHESGERLDLDSTTSAELHSARRQERPKKRALALSSFVLVRRLALVAPRKDAVLAGTLRIAVRAHASCRREVAPVLSFPLDDRARRIGERDSTMCRARVRRAHDAAASARTCGSSCSRESSGARRAAGPCVRPHGEPEASPTRPNRSSSRDAASTDDESARAANDSTSPRRPRPSCTARGDGNA